jgi:hypothetical protein
VEIQILVGGHGKIGYGFAIKNHGKIGYGFVMAWYREENFTSQFQIRNGKSTY